MTKGRNCLKTIADRNHHRSGNIFTLSYYRMMTLRHIVHTTRLNKLLNNALAPGPIRNKTGRRKQSAAYVHAVGRRVMEGFT